MNTYLFFWMFLIVNVANSYSALPKNSPCDRMARCAINKCFDSEKIKHAVETLTARDMYNEFLNQFHFVCVLTKCRRSCDRCEFCHYAQTQIKNFLQGSHTEMTCPTMERCLLKCASEGLSNFMKCSHDKCNKYCFNAECPHCVTMAKLVYEHICREHHILDRPLVAYNGTCGELFEEVKPKSQSDE
ncbi:hypothetical protein AB6A40_000456 [Gnathostoma spinigerum]|uniref:Uncharacterized protein n=1 Tax=Gnathostoma spinigerum TaxID=75299 RepID=A0ABD6EB92_9BILA